MVNDDGGTPKTGHGVETYSSLLLLPICGSHYVAHPAVPCYAIFRKKLRLLPQPPTAYCAI